MIDFLIPYYDKLKAKDKKWLSEKSYIEMFMNIITSMFVYGCDDATVKNDLNFRLELYLRTFGKVGFTKDDDGNFIYGECHYIEPFDFLGRGKFVTIRTDNGNVYTREIGVNAVVIFNNILGHSELALGWLCRQLTENEINEFDLLINARSHPIIVAPDDKTKNILENIFKSSNDGAPRSIAFDGSISNALMGNTEPIKVITVTDPQTAQLFQHYAHYHLDLTERVFNMYGLSTFNTGKMAQTNNLEVSGSLASSMATPLLNYKMRLTAIEEINKLFNLNITVDFSECWAHQVALLKSIENEETSEDTTEDDPSEDEPSENKDEPSEDKDEPSEDKDGVKDNE